MENLYEYKQPRAVRLSWQDSNVIYGTSKLGHTDLVFGLWSKFVSRFVCMQDDKYLTCSGYDLCHTG